MKTQCQGVGYCSVNCWPGRSLRPPKQYRQLLLPLVAHKNWTVRLLSKRYHIMPRSEETVRLNGTELTASSLPASPDSDVDAGCRGEGHQNWYSPAAFSCYSADQPDQVGSPVQWWQVYTGATKCFPVALISAPWRKIQVWLCKVRSPWLRRAQLERGSDCCCFSRWTCYV